MKLKNKIKLFFTIIVLILSLICFNYVNNLDILPNKYLLLFGSIILILNIIASLLLFIKGIISKIFSIILYLILLIISVIGIKYVSTTIKFLDEGFNNNIEYIVYNVIVSKESTYTNLNDLKNSKMGYLFSDMTDDTYLDVIKKKTNVELKELGIEKLYDELLKGNINSIIVNEGYVSLFENTYTDFNEKTRVVDTIKIEKKLENNSNQHINELKPINIYLSGSDSRSGVIPTNTLSDVNMIITINPHNNKILLTSIPRDYYVQLHGTTGHKDKLTHAGFYGIDMSVNTLEDLLGIEIDYYVKVGFNSVIELVDLVGGIDIYSDTAFYSHCGDGGAKRVNVKVGMNHFNGSEALSYARERFAYKDGDIHRIKNQQQVIEAVANKMLTNYSLLLNYDTLLDSLSNLYITNIPSELITLLIKEQIDNMSTFSIEKQNLVGYDGSGPTYSIPNMNLYVMYPNQESVIDASNKILECQTNQ